MQLARLVLVVGLSGLLASAGAWVIGRTKRRWVVWLAGLLTLGTLLVGPLAMPADRRFLRFLAGLAAVTISVKLYDAILDALQGRAYGADRALWNESGFWAFSAFLPNVFLLVRRKAGTTPQPPGSKDLAQLFCAAITIVLGLVICVVVFRADWADWPFMFEHTVKVGVLFLVLIPLGSAASAGWRLLGGRALNFMDSPWAAQTPADFWRRYNRPAGQFLYEDVFKRAGGLRAPARATLVTFAVSAIVHEYLFSIAIGRVEGFQTAFFIVQGIATAATQRLRPHGPLAALALAATLAFNVVTSLLFFAGMDGVVPFYCRGRYG
jgi:hypothetical protein